jgi:hypothetical protein
MGMPREATYPLLLGLAVVWVIWTLVYAMTGEWALFALWAGFSAAWAKVGLSIRSGGDAELTAGELYLSIAGISLGVGFILAVLAAIIQG